MTTQTALASRTEWYQVHKIHEYLEYLIIYHINYINIYHWYQLFDASFRVAVRYEHNYLCWISHQGIKVRYIEISQF